MMAIERIMTSELSLTEEDIEAASTIAQLSKELTDLESYHKNASDKVVNHSILLQQNISQCHYPLVHPFGVGDWTRLSTEPFLSNNVQQQAENGAYQDALTCVRHSIKVAERDGEDHFLSMSGIDVHDTGSFARGIAFLHKMGFIEDPKKNRAKISGAYGNLKNLEIALICKLGFEHAGRKLHEKTCSMVTPIGINVPKCKVYLDREGVSTVEDVEMSNGSSSTEIEGRLIPIEGSSSVVKEEIQSIDQGLVPSVSVAGGTSNDMETKSSASYPSYILYMAPRSVRLDRPNAHRNQHIQTTIANLMQINYNQEWMVSTPHGGAIQNNVTQMGITGSSIVPSHCLFVSNRRQNPNHLKRMAPIDLSYFPSKSAFRTLKDFDNVSKTKWEVKRNGVVVDDSLSPDSKELSSQDSEQQLSVDKKMQDGCLNDSSPSCNQTEPLLLDNVSLNDYVRDSENELAHCKKTRLTVSSKERDRLEQFYKENQYPSRQRYDEIRRILGWGSSRRVTKWFNNRRYNTKQRTIA